MQESPEETLLKDLFTDPEQRAAELALMEAQATPTYDQVLAELDFDPSTVDCSPFDFAAFEERTLALPDEVKKEFAKKAAKKSQPKQLTQKKKTGGKR